MLSYNKCTAHKKGEDFPKPAKLLNTNRSTAYNIIHRHQIAERPKGGERNTKKDYEMVQNIIYTVEVNPEFTLRQMNRRLQEEPPDKPIMSI